MIKENTIEANIEGTRYAVALANITTEGINEGFLRLSYAINYSRAYGED